MRSKLYEMRWDGMKWHSRAEQTTENQHQRAKKNASESEWSEVRSEEAAFGRIEPLELLGARLAPERPVAAREASEAADHVAVQEAEAQLHLVALLFELAHADVLVDELLAVLEGQHEELGHRGGPRAQAARGRQSVSKDGVGVEAAFECEARDGERSGIGGEGASGATEHVAGELVEKNAERHGAERSFAPEVAVSAGSAFI